MDVAFRFVTVAPEDQLLKQKEEDDPGKNSRQYPRSPNVFQRMGDHAEKGGAEQCAGGVADKTGHECFSHAIGEDQEQRRTSHRHDAPQETEHDYPDYKQRAFSSTALSLQHYSLRRHGFIREMPDSPVGVIMRL